MPTTTTNHSVKHDLRLLRDYIDQCSNWGRWGLDDQIGTLNLVGPDQVRAAAQLVRQGKVISLTLPYDQNGPQLGGSRSNPQLLLTATGVDHAAGKQDPLPNGFGPAHGFGFADDILIMPTQSGTQWDALSHIFYKGRMWNGRLAAEVTSKGAAKNGIEHFSGRIVMRALLIDMPANLGLNALQPGHAIGPDDLDDYLAAYDLEVRPGDALLVRTGHLAARRDAWADYAGGPAPGMSLHTAPWLHRHDIAALATDTWGVEVLPNEIDVFQPLHVVSLVHGGLAFGEMFDLDGLAADCATDGIYEFMLIASPLPLTGATGSPVSALALK
jgi:kynurenine formamidase